MAGVTGAGASGYVQKYADQIIALQENIASDSVHRNSKSSVSQLRRTPVRLQPSSLSFEPRCPVSDAIFSWSAINSG